MLFKKDRINQIESDVNELNSAVIQHIKTTSESLEQLAYKSDSSKHIVYKAKKYENPGVIPFEYLFNLARYIFTRGEK